MKDMGKLAIRLFLITAASAIILAMMNNLTAPVIAQKAQEKLAESLVVAYPAAEEFKDAEDQEAIVLENESIKKIFDVMVGGERVGRVFESIGRQGFGGNIEFIVGISNDGVIQGFQVLNHSETPGYGAAVIEPVFAEGVTGNTIEEDLVASEAPSSDNDIQAISGSTITTSAVLRGLNASIEVMREIKD